MNWILVATVIGASSTAPPVKCSADQAAPPLAGELQTGSLIFSQGDCLAVKVFSVSPYTHVGAVIVKNGECTVYDSTGGAGVRKQSLCDYLASQGDAQLCVVHPVKPFSAERAAQFEKHMTSQLGRPYAIAHHLTGHRCEGLHCAEYATDGLIACGVLQAKQPPRVSPASLLTGIERAELYRTSTTVELVPVADLEAVPDSWCGRMWHDTKSCTRSCYRKLRGWFCCK
jgi:hypothetical protein